MVLLGLLEKKELDNRHDGYLNNKDQYLDLGEFFLEKNPKYYIALSTIFAYIPTESTRDAKLSPLKRGDHNAYVSFGLSYNFTKFKNFNDPYRSLTSLGYAYSTYSRLYFRIKNSMPASISVYEFYNHLSKIVDIDLKKAFPHRNPWMLSEEGKGLWIVTMEDFRKFKDNIRPRILGQVRSKGKPKEKHWLRKLVRLLFHLN